MTDRETQLLARVAELETEVSRIRALTEGDPNTIYHEAAALRKELADVKSALVDARAEQTMDIRHSGWSFTYESGEGVRFREDGRGQPLWVDENDHGRAHTEADHPAPRVDWAAMTVDDGHMAPTYNELAARVAELEPLATVTEAALAALGDMADNSWEQPETAERHLAALRSRIEALPKPDADSVTSLKLTIDGTEHTISIVNNPVGSVAVAVDGVIVFDSSSNARKGVPL